MTNPHPELDGLRLARAPDEPTVVEGQPFATDLWTPNNGRTAEFGSVIAATVLGVDRSWAEDLFVEQLATAQGGLDLAPGEALTIGIRVGALDSNGHELTPSRAITGHDQLTTDKGKTVPATYVWPDMYTNRPPQWWNKRLPGEQPSSLIESPLLLLAVSSLQGLKKTWSQQQTMLAKQTKAGTTPTTATEGMSILDHTMLDAAALISQENLERPDKLTFTRFVQHDRDRTDFGGDHGPDAYVYDEQLYLYRSYEYAHPDDGFRVARGLKASILD